MGLRVNQNIAAINSYRNLNITDGQLAKSLEKLSSGFRINRAADDAAGLSISEKLRSQIGGFKVAVRNAQDGMSLVQVAEGALNETTALLQRIRDLAVQAANSGANDQASRDAIGREVIQAFAEINRISDATVFGSKNLLNAAQTFTFHVGYDGNVSNQVSIVTTDSGAAGLLGVASATVVAAITGTNAASALVSIDAALTTVATNRSNLGAVQNRLKSTITNLNVAVENLSASESRIRDTDIAEETVRFTRNQILQQADTSILAQANQLPQGVLSLLRE